MRKTVSEEQKNWGVGSPFILSLVFLIINFAWNHCLYLLFSLCSQYLCSFPEFSPRLPSPEGRAVWFSWAPSPTTDLTAFKKMLWCYSIWAHLCICVFQTGWQKKSTTVLMGKAIQIDGIQIEDFFGRSYHS